jgi:hypothetical protein
LLALTGALAASAVTPGVTAKIFRPKTDSKHRQRTCARLEKAGSSGLHPCETLRRSADPAEAGADRCRRRHGAAQHQFDRRDELVSGRNAFRSRSLGTATSFDLVLSSRVGPSDPTDKFMTSR